MKFLENLLQGAELEWRKLGEVFEIRNGYTPSKSNPDFWEGGRIPWFRMEDLRLNGRILSDSLQHITPIALKGKGLFKANSIILSTTATIGEHALLIADSLANQQFTNFAIRKSLECKLLPKFVYYYFFVISAWCKKNVNTGNFSSVKVDLLKQQFFPIPPISVQAFLVEILDKFSVLTAELEAELGLRRRQYAYYRDKLLDFSEKEVEWRKLGEVCRIYGGLTGKSKSDFVDGNAYFITYKNIYDNISVDFEQLARVRVGESERQHSVMYGDVLFTASSETLNDVGMSSVVTTRFEGSVFLNSFSFGLRFNSDIEILPDFSKHLFRSCFLRRQIIKTANGVTRFNVSKRSFQDILIPFPPLSVQETLVEILDKFDTLANSLDSGLPREIELRRRQYEYYREQLLSFPPKSTL